MSFQGLNELNTIAVNRRWSRKNTTRPNMTRILAVFLGVLCAVWLADTEKAGAMGLSLVTPDGVGVTVKIPLRNFKPVKSDTEIHFYALKNRQRMVAVEAPFHGRFMRIKMAELKFIKRFKNGQPKVTRARMTVPTSVAEVNGTKPLYRKAKFKLRSSARSQVASVSSAPHAAAYATASPDRRPRHRTTSAAASLPGKMSLKRARRISAEYAKQYNALRGRYVLMAKQNPRAARKMHNRVMKLYRVAAQWQFYLRSIQ